MNEIYTALGWQGGTIHQIIAEIARLKKIEIAARDFGNAVCFAAQCGQISRKNTHIAKTGKILNDLIKVEL